MDKVKWTCIRRIDLKFSKQPRQLRHTIKKFLSSYGGAVAINEFGTNSFQGPFINDVMQEGFNG